MPFRRSSLVVWALTVLVAATWSAGCAAALEKPTETPILVVDGAITATNAEGRAEFDRTMLEALGVVGFDTSTPWFSGKARFEGVLLARVLDAAGATGTRIIAYALNDYSSELPLAEVKSAPVLLALKRDGAYMPVRDKGPLFIVYPFDSDPALQNQLHYSRSVWQLHKITVK